MMRLYNIIHPLILSFYSGSLYRDVARNWRGTCFLYLFILLLIVWIPSTYLINRNVSYGINHELVPMARNLPEIKIVNGVLSINKPVPYRIYDPDTDELVAVIDTSGQYTSLEQTKAKMLITSRQIMIMKKQGDVRTITFNDKTNLILGPQQAEHMLGTVKFWIPYILYPLLVILSFVYRMIQVLLYALLALIFARIGSSDLEYPALLRISVIAVTPAIIIATILEFVPMHIPYILWGYFFLTVLYIIFGISSNRKTAVSKMTGVE